MTEREAESSASLLTRAQAGDELALERLLGRCVPRLRRWARGRLPARARDMADTEDLVQDVVLRTIGRLDHFQPNFPAAFDAYLRQAVWNRIRDELRRVSRRPVTSELVVDVATDEPSPLESALGREALERYERCLLELRPSERQAIVGRLELGYSYQELADALGSSSWDAARKSFERAMARLARLMSAHDR